MVKKDLLRFEGGEVSQLTQPTANLTERLWIKKPAVN